MNYKQCNEYFRKEVTFATCKNTYIRVLDEWISKGCQVNHIKGNDSTYDAWGISHLKTEKIWFVYTTQLKKT